MRLKLLLFFLLCLTQHLLAQIPEPPVETEKIHQLKIKKKGKLYFYWGWNRGAYSKSDIRFKGEDYGFTLSDVIAKDRQTKFSVDNYLNPGNITLPQFNARIGYFFKNNWDISIGTDHMKYVVQTRQTVNVSGNINDSSSPYSGSYNNDEILLAEDFLSFEHSDGLNYVSAEIKRFDNILDLNEIQVNLTEGFGLGFLLPRTNTALLDKERYDEFHLSGYGISSMIGLNLSFFEKFFIQSELKGGYINMPDIRTTNSKADSASQSFFFREITLLFGGIININ
jgi:hypothetical protein